MERMDDKWGHRDFKEKVFHLLAAEDFNQSLETFCRLSARRVINPLFSFLCSTESHIRWRAITATGAVVANLAKEDMESARVVMRRILWNLNDESGTIGWGLPEAMGEIMAQHEGLAREYANILISYIRQDGNFMEHEPLQRGVLWGLGRLAQTRPELLNDAISYLHQFLGSEDATIRGLAAWTMGLLGVGQADSGLERLLGDEAEVRLYLNGKERVCRVSDLAREALAADV